MKKTILSILLVVLIVGGIVAVIFAVNKTENNESGKYKVVVSNFASYDFIRAIIGDTDNIDLQFIIGAGKDSHSYEPTAQDIIDMQEADIFIYIGGDLESWADSIVETLESEDTKIIQISDSVNLLDELEHDHEEEEEEEEDHDHEESAFDSHIWTSPDNAILMVEALETYMSELDEENKDIYEQNAIDYIAQINEVDNQIQEVVDSKVRDTLVFGDKMPMQYFVEYYSLEVEAAFDGCSTETEPSSQTIIELVEIVKEENTPVVLYSELNDGTVANLIVEEASTGASIMQIQTLHNVTLENFENGATWVSLMLENIEVLKQALL